MILDICNYKDFKPLNLLRFSVHRFPTRSTRNQRFRFNNLRHNNLSICASNFHVGKEADIEGNRKLLTKSICHPDAMLMDFWWGLGLLLLLLLLYNMSSGHFKINFKYSDLTIYHAVLWIFVQVA